MRKEINFSVSNKKEFKQQLLCWSENKSVVCFLDGNIDSLEVKKKQKKYYQYDFIVGIGVEKELKTNKQCFKSLKKFYDENKDWLFGYISYDVKNELEKLSSLNFDGLNFNLIHFFVPQLVFILKRDKNVKCLYKNFQKNEILNIIDEVKKTSIKKHNTKKITLKRRDTFEDYHKKISAIKKHIQFGDIYELNYCMQYYNSNSQINPISVFNSLNKISSNPFSCFYKQKSNYLMCASPERFIKKELINLFSQPIKGTAKRSLILQKDKKSQQILLNSEKEKSENTMIVDLVRNDLSKSAKKGSVKVEEYLKLYAFKTVYQLISTIKSSLSKKHHLIDAIKFSFPMGSMTGAPKIKAMQLIEKYENHKRGLFSGCVGYFTPDGDFDFNVVIRSILYNQKNKYVSVSAGSAITAKSNIKSEFKECELKAKAMFKALNANVK